MRQHRSDRVPAGPLVSGEWLERNLGNPRVRVLDVRGRHPSSSLPHAKRAEYRQGHVPGAVFVDWEHDFVAVDDPVPVQVASGEDVREPRRRARYRRRRPRRHLRRLLRDLRCARRVGVPFLRRRRAGARRRLDDLAGGGARPERSAGRARARTLHRAAAPTTAADARRGRARHAAPVRRSSTHGRATCSSASRAPRTPATSRERAAFPTRSSWTGPRACGRRRTRSRGSRALPASTPIDPRAS